ncbi:sensor histidine kinase [Agromyces marinus]|uniref:histidine kinase n=1 Tax=Agromyces marinus TaxID=1389020 RepID=A0ABM8H450_9MICO|nr:histidine kinase [Agromyces marinus]UIP59376.1 hypothetical protein DSM26151_22830 [Agromyces marinus]BDZ55584.1 two-component sensor histidine kinase [Agromyces marinus]
MDRRARWHLAQDIGLAAGIAAAALAEVLVPFESVQGPPASAVAIAAIMLVSVALAFRRTKPILLVAVPAVWVVAAVVSGGAVPVLFFGQLVPLALAVYSAARHARSRDLTIIGGTSIATVILADLTQPPLQGLSELIFHWAVLVIVFGAGWGLRTSERRAVDAAVRASEAEAASREAAMQAIADERARIARELHDILGHSVSVMVVQAGAAAQAVDDDPVFVRRALESIRSTGADSLAEVRRVVALLREDEEDGLAPQPGVDGVGDLVEQARAEGLAVDYRVDGDASSLSAGEQLAVYRIVQESLTNVRRHAAASSVVVAVGCGDSGVEVSIEDDGVGTGSTQRRVAAAPPGHGLVGMRERVSLYGGEFAAGPTGDGRGWAVRVTLPAGGGA